MPDLSSYLARINYTGSTEPTLETLKALHLAHLYAVPFENLDIHLGHKIILDEEKLVDKIVTQRRGGFCYELNTAFAWLLRQLGFKASLLSAGVWNGNPKRFGPEADHMCLLVEDLNGRWLADVGFGDSFSEPLSLDDPTPYKQGNKSFRVLHESDDYWVMQELDVDGNLADAYRFTIRPRALYEFTYGCHYHQTSPDTGFTRNVVCSLPVANGRLTLSAMQFIKTTHGQREERAIATPAERLALLREHFNIELPDDAELRSPVG